MKTSNQELTIGGVAVPCGDICNINLKVSESYTGQPIAVPLQVQRAKRPGPTVFVTGAIHGDEVNGTGIVHELMVKQPFELQRGSLLLVPIANVLGFERHSRYLPDRRDLNREFPGAQDGSAASRFAAVIFREIVRQSDFGIDLHSAAVRRTNYPTIRGNLHSRLVRRIAKAFGCELMVESKGPKGSLRRAACRVKCHTISLEAGEVWKIEPGVLELGVRGIRNVLIELGMIEGLAVSPPYQTTVKKLHWLRATRGGLMKFHIAPGAVVERQQPICTIVDVFGGGEALITAPVDGVIIGLSTLPAVKPGFPICSVAEPELSVRQIRQCLASASANSYSQVLCDQLASNIAVEESEG